MSSQGLKGDSGPRRRHRERSEAVHKQRSRPPHLAGALLLRLVVTQRRGKRARVLSGRRKRFNAVRPVVAQRAHLG